MLGKVTTPVIGKLTNSFISGNRAGGSMDVATTSRKSPLEIKIQSPRGLKNYDLGGVGLGIVAALEKSAHHDRNSGNLSNRNTNRSNSIPVNSTRIVSTDPKGRRKGRIEEIEATMMDSLEDYTFVTSHGPGNKSFTRVYYDGGYQEHAGKVASEKTDFERKSSINKRPSMFTVSSPTRIGDFPSIPDSDFLKTCHLCHKKLQGKDIYMYRGEKAFCSSECRDSQILMDEHNEKKCRSEASRSIEASRSSYKNGHGRILTPGIFAI